jgi:hypothetical protein
LPRSHLNLSMAASVGVQARPNAPKPSGRGITRYQRFEYQLVPGKASNSVSSGLKTKDDSMPRNYFYQQMYQHIRLLAFSIG